MISPFVFVAAVLIDEATHPGYSPWRHPMSNLALGPHGWVMDVALLILGAGLVSFAAGLRRVLKTGRGSAWGSSLIAALGVALIAEGFLPTDPSLGYPPGAATTSTLHGTLHLVLSAFESPLMVAACIVLARRFAHAPGGRPWLCYSLATILAVFVFQALGVVTYLSNDPGSPYGLLQRLEFFTLLAWVTALAARLLAGPAFEPERE